jgi:hypothetical protein
MVDRLPSYGTPYLDKHGNIVIPRQDQTPLRRAPGEPNQVEI